MLRLRVMRRHTREYVAEVRFMKATSATTPTMASATADGVRCVRKCVRVCVCRTNGAEHDADEDGLSDARTVVALC